MSIQNNYAPNVSQGNGVTTVFTGNWKVLNAAFFECWLETIATGVRVLLTQGPDYSLTFGESGYSITTTLAYSNLYSIIRSRNVALSQEVPYRTSKGFQGANQENSYDKVTAICQDQQDAINRGPKFKVGTISTGYTIDEPIHNRALKWDTVNKRIINSTFDPDSSAAAAAASAAAAAASALAAGNSQTAAAASAAQAAASAANISQYYVTGANTGGSANNVTLNIPQIPGVLTDGMEFTWAWPFAPTGAATATITTQAGVQAAVGVVYSNNAAVSNGDYATGEMLTGRFNGTNIRIQSKPKLLPVASVGVANLITNMPQMLLGKRPSLISNNVADANNDIDIAAGIFMSSGSTMVLTHPGNTIQLDVAGLNGLDTGSKAAITLYHVHAIYNPTTVTYGGLFSLSATAPILPSGFTQRRLLGAVMTNGSSNIRGFIQNGDAFLYTAPIADISASNPGTNTLRTLPAAPLSKAIISIALGDGMAARANTCAVVTPGQTVTPSGGSGTPDIALTGAWISATRSEVYVDSSRQVRAFVGASDANVSLRICVIGFIMDLARQF